jgi:hypothetical protein
VRKKWVSLLLMVILRKLRKNKCLSRLGNPTSYKYITDSAERTKIKWLFPMDFQLNPIRHHLSCFMSKDTFCGHFAGKSTSRWSHNISTRHHLHSTSSLSVGTRVSPLLYCTFGLDWPMGFSKPWFDPQTPCFLERGGKIVMFRTWGFCLKVSVGEDMSGRSYLRVWYF